MLTRLIWKKGALSTTYKIFAGERQIGHLQDNAFKQRSDGEIHQKKYQFKTEGLFKQHTRIIELGTQKVIGSIEYNSWMNKAEIKLHDRSYHWKYDNSWQSKWSSRRSKSYV